MGTKQAFTDLAAATYCPRQLYYRRRERREGTASVPERDARHELAFRYEAILADAVDLTAAPIAVAPATYRQQLRRTRAAVDRFDALAAPADRDVRLTGRDARGVAHKMLGDPAAPSIVVAGTPPDRGVYATQGVRATAAALALAHEREYRVETAYVEYAAHGVIRRVAITARRRRQYRRALRTARTLDGPPARIDDDAKCAGCDYRERCGVRTRSVRSRLGL